MNVDFQKIVRILEARICSTHGKRPTATVNGKNIELSCCCDAFRRQLEKQIDTEVSKQIDKGLDDMFSKWS